MSANEKHVVGSPLNPAKVKCTRISQPSPNVAHLIIVTMDGRQCYFDLSDRQLLLHAADSAAAAAVMAAARDAA